MTGTIDILLGSLYFPTTPMVLHLSTVLPIGYGMMQSIREFGVWWCICTYVAGGTPRVVKIDDITHALHVHAFMVSMERGNYRGVPVALFSFDKSGKRSSMVPWPNSCFLGLHVHRS